MGFIVGILIIGALLSAIFGRRVAAMFVTGAWAVVMVGIGVLLLLTAPMWIEFFREGAAEPTTASGYTYSNRVSDNAQPSYQSQSSGQAMGASSPVAPPPGGPTMGITTQSADPRLSAQFGMNPGFGATVVSVDPGGPAAQAGLSPGDFVQAMDADPITADHTLTDYEATKGAGQTITLSVQHNDGSRWVHEWVKVTPR